MKRILKTIIVIAMFATQTVVVGCGAKGRPLEELKTDFGKKEEYRVKEGDALMIDVWGEPNVSGEVTVRSDGKFTMPLVKDVDAEGHTLKDLTAEVTKLLRKYIPAASVSISLLRGAPIKYYLSGAFSKPGPYLANSDITFLQAISTGGGFAPFSDESSITLIRQTPEGEVRYQLDYNRVLDGKQPNPILRDGDVIAIR